jgi:hypothetical protein
MHMTYQYLTAVHAKNPYPFLQFISHIKIILIRYFPQVKLHTSALLKLNYEDQFVKPILHALNVFMSWTILKCCDTNYKDDGMCGMPNHVGELIVWEEYLRTCLTSSFPAGKIFLLQSDVVIHTACTQEM